MALFGAAKLIGVQPVLAQYAQAAGERLSFDVAVSEGVRTAEKQAEYVATGKSQVLDGAHMHGGAIDLVPADSKGNPTWPPASDWRWEQLGKLGESFGLTWGGRWSSFVDKPHYEVKNWKALPLAASGGVGLLLVGLIVAGLLYFAVVELA